MKTDESEDLLDKRLARIERAFEHLSDGLSLLGIKPCSWCGKFFKFSDPAALFDGGELVCYACLADWWAHRSPQLSIRDRQNMEHKLTRWLVGQHHAEIIPQTKKLPSDADQELRIVAACQESDATGTRLGERCPFCDGGGTLWVVVRKKTG